MSGSQGCADISIQIQRFALVTVNQPGTSVLLLLPTILKRTAHKVVCAGKMIEEKWILRSFMTPVNETLIHSCAMFTAPRSLSYKKLCLVILNHLSKINSTLCNTAGTDVTVKASASNILTS